MKMGFKQINQEMIIQTKYQTNKVDQPKEFNQKINNIVVNKQVNSKHNKTEIAVPLKKRNPESPEKPKNK